MKYKLKPKQTSYEYGFDYQQKQVEKFRNRNRNHWKFEIDKIQQLFERYVLPRFHKVPEEIKIVDVGCSIGTHAIEFAKKGYRTYGIDFDPSAITIAKELSQEEGVAPEFFIMDISDWDKMLPEIDTAVCSNIFEHLHDDELGALLVEIRRRLSTEGCLIFLTKPTQYNYIFYGKRRFRVPLYPFKFLSEKKFEKIVKIHHNFLDILLLLRRGVTRKEMAKTLGHCNLLTRERLEDILLRAGFNIEFMETAELHPIIPEYKNRFLKYSIARPYIYGVVSANRK